MAKILVYLQTLLFFLSSAPTLAAIMQPNDTGYFIHNKNDYSYVFSNESFSLVPGLIQKNETIRDVYQKEFSWSFNQRADLILASPKNQIANGYATISPNLKTVFFDGGDFFLDLFPGKSWLNTLLTHESAHLYQLSVKDNFSKILHTFMGNHATLPIGFIIHPNIMLPRFILEGNATFNENLWSEGGRLYSGPYLALFLQYLKAGKISSAQLINEHIDFPYSVEKYIIGGFFQYYLAQRFGVETTNGFFRKNAVHWLNPFLLNMSFLATFNFGYEELIRDFIDYFQVDADQQVSSPYRAQASSTFQLPLNSNSSEVFFLTNKTGKTTPILNRINKNTNVWSRESTTLPSGKIFHLPSGYYSRASAPVSPTERKIGLFNKSKEPHPKFNGKFVFDLWDRSILYSLPSDSFDQTTLIIDGQAGPLIHSEARFGPNGNYFYFKQVGVDRVLMKNLTELARWPGYDSKIVEATESHEVFFIAPTEFGSTLYSWKSGQFSRWSKFDTIVDARKLNGNWLLVEVSDDEFKYFTKQLQPLVSSPPYFRQLPFHNHQLMPTLALLPEQSTKLSTEAKLNTGDTPSDTSPPPFEKSQSIEIGDSSSPLEQNRPKIPTYETYSGLEQLRFSTFFPWFGSSSIAGFYGQAFATFTDPLEHYNIEFGASRSPIGEMDGIASFSSTKNLLNWYGGYEYNETKIVDDTTNKFIDFDTTRSLYFGASYNFLKYGYWLGSWFSDFAYVYDSLQSQPEYYDVKSWISLTRLIFPSLSYSAYRYFKVSFGYRGRADAPNWQHNDDAFLWSIDGIYNLGSEWFLEGAIKQSSATSDILYLSGNAPLLRPTPFDFHRLGLSSGTRLREIQKVEFAIKKALPTSHYFSKFPISLRRTVPYIRTNYFHNWESHSVDSQFNEYAYGVELELLLLHKLPMRATIEKIETTSKLSPLWQVYFSTKQQF